MYNIKKEYHITPNTSAADFLQFEVQNFFNYKPKSEKEKYADIWVDNFTGINVKTDKLNAQQNKGRICTAAINEWLRNEKNNLKLLFIRYTNDNGYIKIVSQKEVYIEEVEYEICNQGKGVLQPKRKNGNIVFRSKISREQWLQEFQIKYSKFVDNQINRFINLKEKWTNKDNLKPPLTLLDFFE